MFVEIQPDVLETSSNLIVSCYTSSSKTQPLQCTFGWIRSKNNFSEPMSHSSNTYSCSPYDLGYTISVDIRSKVESKKVSLGIVRMDSLLRIDVANIAKEGMANFIVKIGSKDRQMKEFVVTLKENCVQIADVADEQVFETKYRQEQFQVSGRQSLVLTDDWSSLLKRNQGEMVFVNRTIRDLFMFSYRALGVKNYVGGAHIIHIVHNLELEKSLNFDYLMEIQQLKYNLSRFKKINKQFSKQKEKLVIELATSKQKCTALEEENRHLRQHTSTVKQPKEKPASLKDSRLEISGIINNLSISMGNLEELDRIGAYASTLLSEITSLKGQLKQHQTKQSQMQSVIEYLKRYRDKVKDQTNLPQGDRNHLAVKYKTRVQELRVENEYLFKQKEELSKNLKIAGVSQNVLELKYKRTIEIIDQYSQRLDSVDAQMAGYKQQIRRLTVIQKAPNKQQGLHSPYKEKPILKKGTLLQEHQHSKITYGKLSRSKDISNAPSQLDQSTPDIDPLQIQEAAVFLKWKSQTKP